MNLRAGPGLHGVDLPDGEAIELCSGCGFDGRRYPPGAVVDALGSLKWQWREVLGRPETLVRRRPAPGRWCAVEHAVRTCETVTDLALGVRRFLAEVHPRLPGAVAAAQPPGAHRCDRFDPETHSHRLGPGLDDLAGLVAGLTTDELQRQGSVGGTEQTVLGLARQAVHAGDHHLLVVRRGFASILLREAASP